MHAKEWNRPDACGGTLLKKLPHCVRLKAVAFIMLLRTVNSHKGVQNEVPLVIRKLHFFGAEILTRSNGGEVVFLP